jgi:hypothetical protein
MRLRFPTLVLVSVILLFSYLIQKQAGAVDYGDNALPTNHVSMIGLNSSLPDLLEGPWYVLLEENKKNRIKKVDVLFHKTNEERDPSGGEFPYEVKTRPHVAQGVLIRGLGLQEGEVISIPIPKTPTELSYSSATIRHPTLGVAKLIMQCKLEKNYLDENKLDRWCTTTFVSGHRKTQIGKFKRQEDEYTFPSWPNFIGDLDRDSKYDLIVYSEGSFCSDQSVFLSSRARPNNSLIRVGLVGHCH